MTSAQDVPPDFSCYETPPEEPPAYKEGDSWILHISDVKPDLASFIGFPWHECSTITIYIAPPYDTPDPARAPFIALNQAAAYLKAVSKRALAACVILKDKLENEINAGTMAIKVVFAEC
ncbi:hypothetical protein G647_10148 [Cladophialophora carrionii CBS 160.54]|uniref:Uncharacterized protein n=2 Tax=Cladophialophora carrionii TaxID=86049 RepID=A0A1C1CGH9_9EURO|nr:uncharacterized protein G647_10148 [Cladophialophora carrionii CBS 160.54]ETI27049.1 hypothetical protein G647_10148 [Cladophialophora carrionii CBS 160.54]OCT47625.1 hypothetical protein CLCR_03760 [Cladophialophora carrionii]